MEDQSLFMQFWKFIGRQSFPKVSWIKHDIFPQRHFFDFWEQDGNCFQVHQQCDYSIDVGIEVMGLMGCVSGIIVYGVFGIIFSVVMEGKRVSLHYSEDSNSLLNNELFQQAVTTSTAPGSNEDRLYEYYEVHRRYYEEYKKVYQIAFNLTLKIKKQLGLKDVCLARALQIENQITTLHKHKRIDEIEQDPEDYQGSERRKSIKRLRRTAQEIERKFYCYADFCDRCYGSEGSLQQHIKLKHPELYRREDQEV